MIVQKPLFIPKVGKQTLSLIYHFVNYQAVTLLAGKLELQDTTPSSHEKDI